MTFEWEMLQKTWKSNLNAKWFWRFTKTDIKAPPIGCWHKMFPLWWHKLSSLCKFYSISYCYEGIKGLCQFMAEQQNPNIETSNIVFVWKYFGKHHFFRLFISTGNILCMFYQRLLYKNSIAHTEGTIQRLGFSLSTDFWQFLPDMFESPTDLGNKIQTVQCYFSFNTLHWINF